VKTSENPALKKKKRNNQLKALVFVVIILSCVVMGYWLLALAAAVLAYILNEVFFSDHLFYDPADDYRYDFAEAKEIPVTWCSQGVNIPDLLELAEGEEACRTAFIKVEVIASFWGRWFDPSVKFLGKSGSDSQFFERGVKGVRYINVTDYLTDAGNIKWEFHRCKPQGEATLLAFKHADYRKKRLLIIAPHADDAEIAAFGLYSQAEEVLIVTLTAGEVGEQDYQHVYKDGERAAQLKGQLRAWDSVAIPRWGGVSQDRVVNLGYFCLQLKAMHDDPVTVIPSRVAGIETTALFRQYNTVKLPSDSDCQSTWKNLLEDLSFLIDEFKPDVIVTPHVQLDPHEDHKYATVAVKQALEAASHTVSEFLYYGNHFVHTDLYPFGPPHTVSGLPVNFDVDIDGEKVVSIACGIDTQHRKSMSLMMQHDLQTPLSVKKKLRKNLQAVFSGREFSPCGDDAYLTKAVKANELFFAESTS
jgi:LmbE family N-acetylglucosaminyl deacetylase